MVFESRSRRSQSSAMPRILAAVGIVAVAGGGFAYWRIQQHEAKLALIQDVAAALGTGEHDKITPALERLTSSPHGSAPEASDVVTQARWVLWGTEGIKVGGVTPDPAILDAITESSPLSLIVARAERDLMLRDLRRGKKFMEVVLQKHSRQPAMAELKARFALMEAEADAAQSNNAIAEFFPAMESLARPDAEALPMTKGRIAYGYARACELGNNVEGAVNNYKDALASSPEYTWAAIRLEMAQIPFDADLAVAEASLKKLLETKKDGLSPRQQAAIHIERARKALNTYNLSQAIEPLKAAIEADPSASDAYYLLGQIYLDTGKTAQALEQLDKAQQIAPFDMRVATARATTLLARGDVNGAQKIVTEMPEPYSGFREARVLKARIQRESNNITDAVTLVEGVIERNPDYFEGKLELAMLKRAQKSADAEKQFNDLIPVARTAGRHGMAPVLQAYAATLAKAGRPLALQNAQATAEGEQNALAMAVLGEGMIAAGNKKGAEKLLTQAKGLGDLPLVDQLLQQAIAP